MTSPYVLYDTYQNPGYYCKFRYLQPYCGILEPYVFLTYSEPCHIQNHGIFRIQDIFTSLLRYILVYSKRCVTLAYWEPCHIQNCGIFRTRGTFRHIETHSIMVVIIAWTFFFSLSTKFKKTCFLTTVRSTSMLGWVYLHNTQSSKIALQ